MILVPIVIALIFFLTSGTTTMAAKKSLPGDKLYPIKIFNEKIESLTTFTPQARAQIEIDHVISRLDEVEQIVSSNKQMSTTTRQQIQNKFETQTQEVVKHINKLKKVAV